MKVLLVNPPNRRPKADDFPSLVFQPLGLAYLASGLRDAGYDVEILDCFGEGWNHTKTRGKWKITGLSLAQIKQRIRKFSPDIVGVGIPFTSQAENAHLIFRVVKNIDSRIFTIAGGADPTVSYARRLKDKNLDVVIIGEGEKTLVELVNCIDKGKTWKSVRGIAYRKGRGIAKTKPRGLIVSLDSLSAPARDLLPMDKYFEAAKKARSGRVVSTLGKRWATIITSRGCPFSCIFCTVHQVMGRYWRFRSPEKIVEEIKLLKDAWDINHILFEDDNLTLDIKRAEKIFDLMIKEDLGITWSTPNGVRADRLTERLIKKMKASGCSRLCVAPESGDQEVVMKIIKKNLNLSSVNRVVKWCRKHDLPIEAFFIIGFPGETKGQIKKTLAYAKELLRLGLDEFSMFIATPFVGTELYKIAKKKGYLRENYNEDNLRVEFQDVPVEPLIETSDFSASDLLEFRREAVQISPKYSISKVRFALRLFAADPKLAIRLITKRIS